MIYHARISKLLLQVLHVLRAASAEANTCAVRNICTSNKTRGASWPGIRCPISTSNFGSTCQDVQRCWKTLHIFAEVLPNSRHLQTVHGNPTNVFWILLLVVACKTTWHLTYPITITRAHLQLMMEDSTQTHRTAGTESPCHAAIQCMPTVLLPVEIFKT